MFGKVNYNFLRKFGKTLVLILFLLTGFGVKSSWALYDYCSSSVGLPSGPDSAPLSQTEWRNENPNCTIIGITGEPGVDPCDGANEVYLCEENGFSWNCLCYGVSCAGGFNQDTFQGDLHGVSANCDWVSLGGTTYTLVGSDCMASNSGYMEHKTNPALPCVDSCPGGQTSVECDNCNATGEPGSCVAQGGSCTYTDGGFFLAPPCEPCGGSYPIESDGHCCAPGREWNGFLCALCSNTDKGGFGEPEYCDGGCRSGVTESGGTCGCDAGKYGYDGSGCYNCSKGYFNNSWKSSPTGSGVCSQCPVNTYSDTEASTSCTNCPSGTESLAGSDEASDCINRATCGCGTSGGTQLYRKTSGSSTICCFNHEANVSGTCCSDASRGGFGQSTKCAGGCNSTLSIIGASCGCQAGYKGTAPGGTCTACGHGFWRANTTTSLTSCTECEANEYTVSTTSTLETQCLACPANSTRNGTRDGCVCDAAFANPDGTLGGDVLNGEECKVPCPVGEEYRNGACWKIADKYLTCFENTPGSCDFVEDVLSPTFLGVFYKTLAE